MSTRVVTGAIGAGIGFVVGGPQGAMYGWAIGSAAGSVIDPPIIKGPSVGEIAQQTTQEGVPIPIVFGLSPPIAGNLIATSEPRIVKSKSSGKGGPKIESEVIYRTYAIAFCEGPIGGILRVWRNNTKVYDALDPEFNLRRNASIFGDLPSRNEVFLYGPYDDGAPAGPPPVHFHLGTYDQDADTALEAIFGAGTTPAHRGIAYMVMVDEDVTREGGAVPLWQVQVSASVPQEREVYAQFMSSGTYEVPEDLASVDLLLLGGGGGGGAPGAGGGGAGGLLIALDRAVTPGESIAVVVGAGGAGGTLAGTNQGSNGADSTFDGEETADGGGGGAGPNSTGPSVGQGSAGGCGGGGSRRLTNGNNPGGLGGGGTQGFGGGQGWQSVSCNNSGYGGGGGGLGGVGEGGTNSGDKAGGPGITLSSTGFGAAFMGAQNIGGGGGGGSCNGGNGGFGGGGEGGNSVGGGGAAGAANTGGGGGGEVVAANAGGSGLVLVRERYLDSFRYSDNNANVKALLRVFGSIEDLTGNSSITKNGAALSNYVTARNRRITPSSFFNNGTTTTGRYITLRGASGDFVFGGEFCVEGDFYYPSVVSTSQQNTLFTIGGFTTGYSDSGVTGLLRVVQDAGNQRLLLISGASTTLYTGGSNSFTAGAWHHVALLRILVGGNLTLRLYIDGTQVYSATNTNTFGNTFVSGLSTIYLGRGTNLASQRDWTGYWQRFKVTNGEPVYSGNFTPPTTFNSSGSDDIDGAPIVSVVESICDRAGLVDGKIDASLLGSGLVRGLLITNQYPAFQALQALGQIYNFDIAKYDSKVRFIPRGGNSVATISEDEMVEDDQDIEQAKKADAMSIPRVLNLAYYDADSDALMPAKQTSERTADSRAKGDMSIDSAVVMDADRAAQSVVIAHKVMAEEQKGELRFALSDKYLNLTPGDPIIAQYNGKSERVRIQQVDIQDGKQDYILLRDRQSAYTSVVEGIPPPVIPTPPSQVRGPTLIAVLDIPLLRDADDNAGLGYYVAVSGVSDGWAGATVELSYDGGANYPESRQAPVSAVMGILTSALPDHPAEYPDDTNEFSVEILTPNGELEETDLEGMLNGANLAAIGSTETGWELIQFSNAVPDSGGTTWALSGLLRGRKHTATTAHAEDAIFVLLNRALLGLEPAQISDLGRTLTFRATSAGQTTDTGTVVNLTYAGQTQVEFPASYLAAERDGANIVAQWQSTPRLGAGASTAHGTHFIGFRVTFDDGVDQITLDTISTTVTQDVSSLSGPVTVTVVQRNSLTGEGPASQVTVP